MFPPGSDSYESFSLRVIDRHLAALDLAEETCPADDDFLQMYDDAAQATRRYLSGTSSHFRARVDGAEALVTTELFWKGPAAAGDPRAKNAGFGTYGPFGRFFGINIAGVIEIHVACFSFVLGLLLMSCTCWFFCCFVVLFFQESSRMEAAYGLSITITMLMTSILLVFYLFFAPITKTFFVGVIEGQ